MSSSPEPAARLVFMNGWRLASTDGDMPACSVGALCLLTRHAALKSVSIRAWLISLRSFPLSAKYASDG